MLSTVRIRLRSFRASLRRRRERREKRPRSGSRLRQYALEAFLTVAFFCKDAFGAVGRWIVNALRSIRFLHVWSLLLLAVVGLAVSQAALVAQYLAEKVPQVSAAALDYFLMASSTGLVLFAFASLIAAVAGSAYLLMLSVTAVVGQGSLISRNLRSFASPLADLAAAKEAAKGYFDDGSEEKAAESEELEQMAEEQGFSSPEEMEEFFRYVREQQGVQGGNFEQQD